MGSFLAPWTWRFSGRWRGGSLRSREALCRERASIFSLPLPTLCHTIPRSSQLSLIRPLSVRLLVKRTKREVKTGRRTHKPCASTPEPRSLSPRPASARERFQDLPSGPDSSSSLLSPCVPQNPLPGPRLSGPPPQVSQDGDNTHDVPEIHRQRDFARWATPLPGPARPKPQELIPELGTRSTCPTAGSRCSHPSATLLVQLWNYRIK